MWNSKVWLSSSWMPDSLDHLRLFWYIEEEISIIDMHQISGFTLVLENVWISRSTVLHIILKSEIILGLIVRWRKYENESLISMAKFPLTLNMENIAEERLWKHWKRTEWHLLHILNSIDNIWKWVSENGNRWSCKIQTFLWKALALPLAIITRSRPKNDDFRHVGGWIFNSDSAHHLPPIWI